MDDDWQLLRQFAAGKNQAAFSELVRRYVDFVYRCARRMLGGPGMEAEDVTQAVFLLLAQKAPRLRPRGTLAGWLFNVTRHCCRNVKKMAARRRKHEREAAMQRDESPAPTGELSGILDDALAALGTRERDAVLARFLQQKTAAEVAALLGISVAAAEKRTQRGLQKLRAIFASHGFAVPSANVGSLLAAANALTVPAALATKAAAVTTTASAAAAGLARSTAMMMKAIAVKTTAATATCALLLLGAAVALFAAQQTAKPSAPAASAPVAAAPATVAATIPVTPAPAATVNYQAIVHDENGKPVANALVKLELTDWPSMGIRVEAQTKTAADGSLLLGPVASLPDFGWSWRTIVVDAPGLSWGWYRYDWTRRDGMPPPEIRVTRPTAIGGVAVDDHGHPIAGADVQLYVLNPPEFSLGDELAMNADNGRGVKTDAQGHFQFNRIPQGTRAFIKVLSPGFATYDEERFDSQMAPPVVAGQTHLRLVLHQGAQAEIALIDGGHPLAKAGVRVVALHASRIADTVQTDDRGIAAFTGLEPGTYSFGAVGTGIAEQGLYAEPTPEMTLNSGEKKTITVQCRKGHLLRGQLTRTGGIPPGVVVMVGQYGVMGPIFYGPPDAAGRFQTTVGPGDYFIHANALGGNARVTLDGKQSKKITVAAGEYPINLAMQIGDLWHGRLVDEHGQGVPGFVSDWGARIQTRPDGRFELPIDPTPGFTTAWSKDEKLGCLFFHATAGGEHLITMKPMGEISGWLKLPPGRTAAEVKLMIYVDCGYKQWSGYSLPAMHTTIEEDGAFRIGPVPVGQGEYIDAPENDPGRDADKTTLGSAMYVLAELEGNSSGTEPTFTPTPGELQDIGTVEVLADDDHNVDFSDRKNKITGLVVNEKGQPVIGLRVNWGGQQGSDGITDLDGHFELTHLPAGELTLGTYERRGYGSPQFKVASPSENVRLQMFPPAWKWVGKPAPEPVVDKWISGNVNSLHDLRGHVVLLAVGSYGASQPIWKDLKELQQKYAAKGLKVVAVYAHIPSEEVDGYSDPNLREEDVAKLATDTGLIFAIDGSTKRAPPDAPANASGYGATDMLYGAANTFTNQPLFVIDRKGILLGSATPANAAELIEKALAE